MDEKAIFYIECPCNCGRAMKIEVEEPPGAKEKAHNFQELGNMVWQSLVGTHGFEGAIEHLHECR